MLAGSSHRNDIIRDTSSCFKDRSACSVASNSSTTLPGGATPDSASSTAGAALPEEVSLELESLRVYCVKRINLMEDEFRNRVERLEARLDSMYEECRDECKAEVQQAQAGVLAVAEKAANLAAESKRECDRVGARTKWCSVPLVEAMLHEKLEEASLTWRAALSELQAASEQASCTWQATLSELKAVSEERWWGLQAQNASLSASLEELQRESKYSLSMDSKLTERSTTTLQEVACVDDDCLGSTLRTTGSALQVKGPGPLTMSRLHAWNAWEQHDGRSKIDGEIFRDSLPPASNRSLPASAIDINLSCRK